VETADRILSAITMEYRPERIVERYGGLRFYYEYPSMVEEELQERGKIMVEALEVASFKICEGCGGKAERRATGGWWETRCAKCRAITKKM
jgi:hypothetical protein